jgi:vitamin K-dependent gamma-carboxylase
MLARNLESLFRPVSASSLGLFRMLFGVILIWQMFCGFNLRFLEENFLKAHYHFPFALFEALNLPHLSPMPLNLLVAGLGVAALLIFAGVYFRIACLIFLFGFLYIFLSEKSIYNDYYYLVLLITLLLTFTGADLWPTLKTFRRKKTANPQIPFWQIFILRIQFVIVYFYAALAKISFDWLLDAQPLKRVLAEKTFLGFSGDQIWLAYLFSWGGFILDLALAIVLLWGRWRYFAFAGILFFNLINLWLFQDILAFPFLMMAGLVLFLNPETPARIIQRVEKFIKARDPETPVAIKEGAFPFRRPVVLLLGAYLIVQILVPARHWLYPGNPSWTYEGARFAWRLKINAKKVDLKITVTDPATGKSFEVYPYNVLTAPQAWMDNVPDMLIQYAHYLKKDLENAGLANPVIRAEAYAKLNDRPRQRYIDGQVNLAEINYPLFSHAQWIVPLKEK